MAGLRRIVTSSLVMLQVLSCTAASGVLSSFIVRDGDDVTLPCDNETPGQDECDRTTWLFVGSGSAVPLFEDGKIHKGAEDKSDRLSVSEKCSLVIKKVRDEDAGPYSCRRFRSGHQGDVVSDLSVVTMTELEASGEVTAICSVSIFRRCEHAVKWLYEGNGGDVVTSQLTCSARLSVKKSRLHQQSYQLLKCEVTDGFTGEVHEFTFSRPASSGWWWILICVAAAALLVITVLSCRRTKEKKKKTEDGVADPEEEGVSYASVSYTKKTDSATQTCIQRDEEDDEGDSVTDSAVNPPSSSAAASVDPGDLYASVHKPSLCVAF